ncbi:MAG: aldo/keto reductase [Candidatus Hydrogenedentota bacterium]
MSMIYRDFGNTGAKVSALGMGCMRFADPQSIDEMAQVVYGAYEAGVTYFDTAPGYCEDKSEIILGTAVKEMKKDGRPFHIATKSGAGDPAEIRRHCERSLERLHVDAIDFYHVWALVHPENLPKRKAQGALDEFRKLKEEGLIRHISVSTHLEHDKIAAMLDQSEGLFESMLIGLSAANYDLRYPGIREAKRRGMGVATMNTLGGGLIPAHPKHFEVILHEGDRSVVEAAIRFNLSIPEVHVALVGFRNVKDVEEAVRAVERFAPLCEEDIQETALRLAESAKDFCTQCGYCRNCPQGIPVVRLMASYNRRLLEGNMQAALDVLRYHWGISDVREVLAPCTECQECEKACTQHLPILDRFAELKRAQTEKESAH